MTTVNETRKNLIEKHRETLAAMAKAGEPGDMGTLFDKLKYTAEHREHLGEEGIDVYKGIPEDFDWTAFDEDLKTLE